MPSFLRSRAWLWIFCGRVPRVSKRLTQHLFRMWEADEDDLDSILRALPLELHADAIAQHKQSRGKKDSGASEGCVQQVHVLLRRFGW